ncbi:MAG: DEAD/DEAH box helicase [archaeon]
MKFAELKLIDPLLRSLEHEGYTIPTPIQEQSIPILLKGKDLMGIAQTGTGKTAAFLLPILQQLHVKKLVARKLAPVALILAPTRELAAQIDLSCKIYGRFLGSTHTVIFGGVGQNSQVKAIRQGADILVATPGRLLDLMQQGHIRLDSVEIFVLDEADRMLDMGFIHDVKKIISNLPRKRQTLCFSATMSMEVEKLARTLLNNPEHVAVTPQATTVDKVEQHVFFVDQENKDEVLASLLKDDELKKILIFTRTKHRANKVTKKLNGLGINADAIHGNKSQVQRTKALSGFQRGKTRVLVATDIAARGIDVENITHVINYDLPNEAENYVHRIGRTARAGARGIALSFCAADERGYLHDIEKLIKQSVEVVDHPHHSNSAQTATGPNSRSAHQQGQKGQGNNRSQRPKRGSSRSGGSQGGQRQKPSRGQGTSRRWR